MPSSRTSWTSNSIPFARNRPLHNMIYLFIAYFCLMAISPVQRLQWFAECTPLLAILIVLVLTYKRYRFSNSSYLMMLIFFSLHVVAAHYTYEGTPFEHWLKPLFHTKRSNYDRVVHFFFGVLISYPIRELLENTMKFRRVWSYVLPIVFIAGISGFFEIVEWLAAAIYGKGGEERFIGMQGDIFDTQKDMAVALVGVLVATAAYFVYNSNQKQS